VELYYGIKRIKRKEFQSDWATHMIGHGEIIGIDHALCTLQVITPSLYKVMFETKRKIGTIRKRIFNLTRTEDEIANRGNQ
jgi:alcohol dehydrogenase YqhD (iron-dependent ADH family)